MKHLNFAVGMTVPGLEGIALEAIDDPKAAQEFHNKMTGKAPADLKGAEDAAHVNTRLHAILQKTRDHVAKVDFGKSKPINVGKLVKLVGAERVQNPQQLIAHIKRYNGGVGEVVTEIANVGKAVKAGKMSAEQAHKVANEDQHKLLDKHHAAPHPVKAMVFTKADILGLLDAALAANAKAAQHNGEVVDAGKQTNAVATEDFGEFVGKALNWVFKIVFKVLLIYVWIQVFCFAIVAAIPTFGLSVLLGYYVLRWLGAVWHGVTPLSEDDSFFDSDKYDDSLKR